MSKHLQAVSEQVDTTQLSRTGAGLVVVSVGTQVLCTCVRVKQLCRCVSTLRCWASMSAPQLASSS
jgi:hypothetical protein